MTPNDILNSTLEYHLDEGKQLVEMINKELNNKLIFNDKIINPIVIKLPFEFANVETIINAYKLKYEWENITIETEEDTIYNYVHKYSNLLKAGVNRNIRITKLSFYHNLKL